MKKILCFAISLCLFLIGCAPQSNQPQPETQIPTTTVATNAPTDTAAIVPQQEAMYAVSVPVISENTLADDGTVIFSHSYQDMMLTIPDPDVANKVIVDFLTRIRATDSAASDIRASAEARYNGSDDWSVYLYNITYNPTRLDPGVLSMLGSCITYTGGSHPERLSVAANYDLVTGDILTLGSIMSATATTTDFCNLVISALKEQKNLYDDFEAYIRTRFAKDESQDQDWYFSNTGLCFYFDPYEIAPYASGTIIAEIPYADLAGLLYEGYFPPEREMASGSIYEKALDAENMPFTQVAELVLDSDGEMALLYTDGIIWNVTVEYGAWDASGDTFIPVYTALMSSALSPGDAIMIQADDFSSLRYSYYDGTQTVQKHFDFKN